MPFEMPRHSPISISSWPGISFQRLPVGKPYVTMQGKEERGGPLISRYEKAKFNRVEHADLFSSAGLYSCLLFLSSRQARYLSFISSEKDPSSRFFSSSSSWLCRFLSLYSSRSIYHLMLGNDFDFPSNNSPGMMEKGAKKSWKQCIATFYDGFC